MSVTRFMHTASFAVVFLFVFMLASLSASAQGGLWDKTKEGVEKGAGTVEKDAVKAGEKTKEGAEAAGRGIKNTVTGDDSSNTTNREKSSAPQTQQPATSP